MLDWGLRLVLLLALPCAVALLVFPQALVAVLYHYGAFSARDVAQTVRALIGYGVGLLGLVGDQGAGAGLLRAAGHPHAGEDRHRRAGGHAAMNLRARALARPRRAGAVDRPGRAGQRRLAAGGPAAARRLPAARRAGAASRCAWLLASAAAGRGCWPGRRAASTGSACRPHWGQRAGCDGGGAGAASALLYFARAGGLRACGLRQFVRRG